DDDPAAATRRPACGRKSDRRDRRTCGSARSRRAQLVLPHRRDSPRRRRGAPRARELAAEPRLREIGRSPARALRRTGLARLRATRGLDAAARARAPASPAVAPGRDGRAPGMPGDGGAQHMALRAISGSLASLDLVAALAVGAVPGRLRTVVTAALARLGPTS